MWIVMFMYNTHIEQHEKYTKDTLSKNIQEFHPQPLALQLQLAVLCKNLVYIFFVSFAIKEKNLYTNNVKAMFPAWERFRA